MKLLKIFVAAILALAAALTGGCSDDDGIDNRDLDYGYVQFKLYKEASYDAVSRAQKPQLDYLYEAAKVQVSLGCNGTTVTQTLTLSASDKESAEFGLRSEKLRLLTGQYQIITFSLYNANDELIYNGMPLDDRLVVEAGGLQVHDLTVDVEPRGKVRFTIRKDLSDFTETPVTRAANRQYTFDEIAFISLTVKQGETNEQTTFKMLPTKFSIHFDEDDDTFGYQTSSLECDTLLSLKAGSYKMMRYETYDKNKLLLENNKRPKNLDFVIEDNKTTETKVGVTLYEADEYIRDYYALYEIWKALDGPNWYFSGENYPEGTNWDFNKDPDLWGIQPGVEVHSNGRVAKITLSDFGFRGHLPAAIGQLTQLIELYLGSHNDANLLEYDPSIAPDKSLSERKRTRMERNKEFLRLIHTPTQTSEPIARALKEHNLTIPGISLYEENYTEDEIIDRKTGLQKRIRPYDVVHGKLTNGLKSIDPAIGKLENLEYLFVANGEIETLPDELANLADRRRGVQLPQDDAVPDGARQAPGDDLAQHFQQLAVVGRGGLQGSERHRQRPCEGEATDSLRPRQQSPGSAGIVPEPQEDRPAGLGPKPDRDHPSVRKRSGSRAALPRQQQTHVAARRRERPFLHHGRRRDLLGDLQQIHEVPQHLLGQEQVHHQIGRFLLQRD